VAGRCIINPGTPEERHLGSKATNVRLGPACMASFPLRDPVQLAYQWASLDLLAEGRSVLVACTGIVEQSATVAPRVRANRR
jgi:alkanesulfonate monooxygenase SsuD/methylene tetrahydromethanopterin reductase-like flavin-dependent oxidoreductase (luciferase family)